MVMAYSMYQWVLGSSPVERTDHTRYNGFDWIIRRPSDPPERSGDVRMRRLEGPKVKVSEGPRGSGTEGPEGPEERCRIRDESSPKGEDM